MSADVVDQALALLGQDPLPADAFQQLAALEQRATPEQRPLFEQLWEGFYAAGGVDPDDDPLT